MKQNKIIFFKNFVINFFILSYCSLSYIHIHCRCVLTFLISASHLSICLAHIITRLSVFQIILQESICHIRTSSSIENTVFFSWSIQNRLIFVFFFTIIQSVQNTAERWVIQLFISVSVSLIINFDKALTINLWFISIISFVCKLYNKMIIQWISYFFIRIFITFLFSDSLSQISFWKHSCQQIIFFQKNFAILAEFNKASALISDYSEKLFWASIM